MKKSFLISALIVALALSGCIQPVPDYSGFEGTEIPSGEDSAQGESQDSELVQCPDGSMVASSDLCIDSEEPPPVNTNVESCGSMDIANLAMATGSAEEKAGLLCFNQNMASCINSTFELTGQFGGVFSVLGEEEANCIISYYDNTDRVQKNCRFPKSFLETTVQSAEQASQPELPIILVSAGMTSKTFQNSQTGEEIEIVCG